MKSTLLDISDLPKFSELKIEEIEPVIDSIIKENNHKLEDLLSKYKTGDRKVEWDSLSAELEVMDNLLSRVWSPVSHLNSVLNTDKLRQAYDNCLPKLSTYQTEKAQNKELYNLFSTMQKSSEFDSLNQENKKTIKNTLLQFRLNGVALGEEEKIAFKNLENNLSSLKSKFEQNVLDATQAYRIHIEEKSQLSGLPEFIVEMARQAAAQEDLKGWLFTLDAPSYIGVMTYSDKRQFREEMYTAFCTRASNKGPNAGEFNNTQIIENILSAQKEQAKILGFNNYAAVSIATKMAETTQDVLLFLEKLVDKSKPQAEIEFNDLKLYAKKHCKINKLEAWDVMYVSEKLKQNEYGISQQELKPYFPAPKVIQGLFNIVNRLYGIKITEKKGVDVWHNDVLFFEVHDEENNLRGQFYLDLYARNNKRGGAWMDECTGRMIVDNRIQIPVAYLTCNLTPPVGDKPALLGHNEVATLFHEFGHGLQHMLTKVDCLGVSGISGVEWDAVELPSQFMENWCWEKEGLEMITSHVETGETLPQDLYNKLIKAKNFQSAMIMVRQLEFALFDFRLQIEYASERFKGVQALLDEVRSNVAVIIPPAFNQFQHGFSHIFSGGYAAGYYSYKWAEVLSADAFSKFEENGIFDSKTGKEFLHSILETGGSEKAMDLFKRFRGREPEINALLRHSGLSH